MRISSQRPKRLLTQNESTPVILFFAGRNLRDCYRSFQLLQQSFFRRGSFFSERPQPQNKKDCWSSAPTKNCSNVLYRWSKCEEAFLMPTSGPTKKPTNNPKENQTTRPRRSRPPGPPPPYGASRPPPTAYDGSVDSPHPHGPHPGQDRGGPGAEAAQKRLE